MVIDRPWLWFYCNFRGFFYRLLNFGAVFLTEHLFHVNRYRPPLNDLRRIFINYLLYFFHAKRRRLLLYLLSRHLHLFLSSAFFLLVVKHSLQMQRWRPLIYNRRRFFLYNTHRVCSFSLGFLILLGLHNNRFFIYLNNIHINLCIAFYCFDSLYQQRVVMGWSWFWFLCYEGNFLWWFPKFTTLIFIRYLRQLTWPRELFDDFGCTLQGKLSDPVNYSLIKNSFHKR